MSVHASTIGSPFSRGDSGVFALVRETNWAATPLGATEGWSPALRAAVGIVLHAKLPMVLRWGVELVQVYNDAYVTHLGPARHPAAMGQRTRDCWPEVWPSIEGQMRAVLERGEAVLSEERLLPVLRGGALEDAYWNYSYSPVFEDDGTVGGVLCVAQEATGLVRARAEAARTHAEAERARERLANLVQRAPAFVCTLRGPGHVFELVNGPYQELVGRARRLVGRGIAEALPEVVEQGFLTLLDGVYRSGEPFVGAETRVGLDRLGNGQLDEAYVNFVYQPWRGSGGEVEGIDVFGFEVTEQVRARASALNEVAARELLGEAIPQQVWTATPDGALDFVNDRVLDYFAATREEVLGAGWLAVLHPDDVARTVESWTRSLASGEPYEVEFRLRRADGSYRWHLGRAFARRDAQGRVQRWFGTNTDVDEHKRAIEELRRRTEFEQQVVGIVSHDLRNPLHAITLGATAMASMENLPERAAKMVLRMQSAARRGTKMIHDLLDFTQARLGGGLPIERKPTDLHEVAARVADEVSAAHPERELVVRAEGDGGGSFDAERVGQALANLLSNAVHYGSADRPVRVRSRGAGPEVHIEVHNEGPAIPEEARARLFEPLERGEQQRRNSARSIGLGLFIVKEIAVRHGGSVEVASSAGEGTTFRIRLPRAEA